MGCTEGFCNLKWINSFRKYCIMYQVRTEGAQALESRIQVDFHHQFPPCRDFARQIFLHVRSLRKYLRIFASHSSLIRQLFGTFVSCLQGCQSPRQCPQEARPLLNLAPYPCTTSPAYAYRPQWRLPRHLPDYRCLRSAVIHREYIVNTWSINTSKYNHNQANFHSFSSVSCF